MIAAASRSGALLAGIFQLRLVAGAQAMKRAVMLGRFGRLTLCGAQIKWWRDRNYYDAAGWRGDPALSSGGALMNQGIHGVDLLHWLAGMPSEVFAFSGCLAHERIEVEDTIAVALKYPNGAMGVIEASTACKPGFAMRIEICGDTGSATLEGERITRWQFDEPLPGDERILNLGPGEDGPSIRQDGHRLLVEDFVGAIRDKRPPMIPGSEAKNAVRLILAAYESAKTGRMVSTAS